MEFQDKSDEEVKMLYNMVRSSEITEKQKCRDIRQECRKRGIYG